jgi:hypothetical protein
MFRDQKLHKQFQRFHRSFVDLLERSSTWFLIQTLLKLHPKASKSKPNKRKSTNPSSTRNNQIFPLPFHLFPMSHRVVALVINKSQWMNILLSLNVSMLKTRPKKARECSEPLSMTILWWWWWKRTSQREMRLINIFCVFFFSVLLIALVFMMP